MNEPVEIRLVIGPVNGYPDQRGTFVWKLWTENESLEASGTVTIQALVAPPGFADQTHDATLVQAGGQFSAPVELPPGQYRVTFRLRDRRDDQFILSEVLHVYENLESRYELELVQSSFPRHLLDVILDGANTDGNKTEWNIPNIIPAHFVLLGILGVGGIKDFADEFGFLTSENRGPVPSGVSQAEKTAGMKELVDAASVLVRAREMAGQAGFRKSQIEPALNDPQKPTPNETLVETEWLAGTPPVLLVTVGGYRFALDFDKLVNILEMEVASVEYGSGLLSDVSSLTLMPGENTATVTVSLSGFGGEDEANTAESGWEADSHFTMEEAQTQLPATMGQDGSWSRDFRLSVEWKGTGDFPLGIAPVPIGFGESTAGYEVEPNETRIDLKVTDGLTKDPARQIPVGRDNIHRFNEYANTAQGSSRHYRLTGHVLLGKPDDSNGSNWDPVGNFTDRSRWFKDSFDGDGYSISGLQIVRPNVYYMGLFSRVDVDGEIRNLGVRGIVNGGYSVGGIVGELYGNMERCFFHGLIITNIAAGGGGLVGYTHSAKKIVDSYVAGYINGYADAGG